MNWLNDDVINHICLQIIEGFDTDETLLCLFHAMFESIQNRSYIRYFGLGAIIFYVPFFNKT